MPIPKKLGWELRLALQLGFGLGLGKDGYPHFSVGWAGGWQVGWCLDESAIERNCGSSLLIVMLPPYVAYAGHVLSVGSQMRVQALIIFSIPILCVLSLRATPTLANHVGLPTGFATLFIMGN